MKPLKSFILKGTSWGDLKIKSPVPSSVSAWGPLQALQGTFFEKLIPVVSGETFSHALHGHAMPLIRELGVSPKVCLRKVPKEYKWCARYQAQDCVMANNGCHVEKQLPDCFEIQGAQGKFDAAGTQVLLSWRDGFYVIVVEGSEFSLI